MKVFALQRKEPAPIVPTSEPTTEYIQEGFVTYDLPPRGSAFHDVGINYKAWITMKARPTDSSMTSPPSYDPDVSSGGALQSTKLPHPSAINPSAFKTRLSALESPLEVYLGLIK